MSQDRPIVWEEGSPYDRLASVEITPNSSMREVRDASYTLMSRGAMTPEMRRAWDTLRFSERRLVVDFFLYIDELRQPSPE